MLYSQCACYEFATRMALENGMVTGVITHRNGTTCSVSQRRRCSKAVLVTKGSAAIALIWFEQVGMSSCWPKENMGIRNTTNKLPFLLTEKIIPPFVQGQTTGLFGWISHTL